MSYNFDPEFKDQVDSLPLSNFGDVQASRKGFDEMLDAMSGDTDTSGLLIEDLAIPGLKGDPDVPVRLYQPADRKEQTGAMLHIHGGGFAIGNLESEHASVCSLVRELGVPILSVDYRLAPEHPFPAPLDDCYAALRYLAEQSTALNINAEKIAVTGMSAGGGLAAGTVLKAKEQGGPAICFQHLGIPELDDRLTTPSMTQFTDTPMWNRPNAEFSWKFYLGEQYTPGGSDVPITAAPARASIEDCRGLPPAYIDAMEFDPLRDEAINYAMTLLAAGVQVELHVYPGTFHGSSLFTHAAVSQRQQADMIGALQRVFS